MATHSPKLYIYIIDFYKIRAVVFPFCKAPTLVYSFYDHVYIIWYNTNYHSYLVVSLCLTMRYRQTYALSMKNSHAYIITNYLSRVEWYRKEKHLQQYHCGYKFYHTRCTLRQLMQFQNVLIFMEINLENKVVFPFRNTTVQFLGAFHIT